MLFPVIQSILFRESQMTGLNEIMSHKTYKLLILSGGVITIVMVFLNWLLSQAAGDASQLAGTDIPRFLLYYFTGFLIYLVAVYIVRTHSKNNSDTSKTKWYSNKLNILILLTLLMRLPFLLADPSPGLSDDIFRYWWDGKVQSHHINPYRYSPEDFPHKDLKVEPHSKVNHPDIPTIYAPFLQAVFYVSYSIHPSIMGIKGAFILFELLTLMFVILWLKKQSLPLAYFIIYGWNPLVIVEIYNGGHTDSLLGLLLVLTLYLYQSPKKGWSLVTLALLTLTKYIGLVFLPLYYRKVSWRYFLLYFLIIGLFYLYYYDANMFTGLIKYGRYWKYNSFIYKGLFELFNHEQIPKIILGLLFIGIYWKKWYEAHKDESLFGKSFLFILACILLFSPVLHPWYLVIILPGLVIYFSRAWLVFSGLIFLSYIILIQSVWKENVYVLMSEYIPFYTLLIYDYFKSKKMAH